MANVCVICKKEISEGTPLRVDAMIRLIRRLKEMTHTLQNNTLMVCDADLESYRKKRQGFERNAVLYCTGAVLVSAFLIFAPLLIGAAFSVINIFFALVLGVMIAAFSIFSYVPALDEPAGNGPAAAFGQFFAPKKAEERKPEDIAKRLAPAAKSPAEAAKPAPAQKRKEKAKPSKR